MMCFTLDFCEKIVISSQHSFREITLKLMLNYWKCLRFPKQKKKMEKQPKSADVAGTFWETWENIPTKFLQTLQKSMSKRIQEVVKGGHTSY